MFSGHGDLTTGILAAYVFWKSEKQTKEVNLLGAKKVMYTLWLGMCRVITRPEIDPTRSKETKYTTRTRPENFKRLFYPTRPEPEFFQTDPKDKKI